MDVIKDSQNLVDKIRMSFDTAGYFYIVTSEGWEAGTYKFGIAKHMQKRHRQYETANPKPVEIVKLFLCRDMTAIEDVVKLMVGDCLLPRKLEWVKSSVDNIVNIFNSVTELDPFYIGQVPKEWPVYRLKSNQLKRALEETKIKIDQGKSFSKSYYRKYSTLLSRQTKLDSQEIKESVLDEGHDHRFTIVTKVIQSGKPELSFLVPKSEFLDDFNDDNDYKIN